MTATLADLVPTPDAETVRRLLALLSSAAIEGDLRGSLGAERAYTIPEAAAIKGVSPDYVRRAIRATEAPFLRAKKVGKGYRIAASALEDWWNQLEDA